MAVDLLPLPAGTRARIVAVIRAMRLDAVLEQLHALAPRDVQIEEVRGYGRQKEHLAFYEQVGDWQGSFLPKVRLEFSVDADVCVTAVNAVRTGGLTGRIGDGKIFVHPVRAARSEVSAAPTNGGATPSTGGATRSTGGDR